MSVACSAAPTSTGARVAPACARCGSAGAAPRATGAQAPSSRTAARPMRGRSWSGASASQPGASCA
eukprot:3379024-Alexandrium_andersonii.AAC.1